MTGLTSLIKMVGVDPNNIIDLINRISIGNAELFNYPDGDPRLNFDPNTVYSRAWYYKRTYMIVFHHLVRENRCFTNPSPNSPCNIVFPIKISGRLREILAAVSIDVYQNPWANTKISFSGGMSDTDFQFSFVQNGYTEHAFSITRLKYINIRTEAPDIHRFVHITITIVPLKVI